MNESELLLKAKVLVGHANKESSHGDFEKALSNYDTAIKIYGHPQFSERQELIALHAKVQLKRAIVLHEAGDLEGALSGFSEVIELCVQPQLRDSCEFDADRAIAHRARAALLLAVDVNSAINEYRTAIEIYSQPHIRDHRLVVACFDDLLEIYAHPQVAERHEYDADRARFQGGRAISLMSLGYLEESMAAFDATLEILTQPHLSAQEKIRVERARVHSNRGVVFRRLGDLEGALAEHDAALKLLYAEPDIADRPELDAGRAKVHVNRANVLRDCGELDAALKAYDSAHALYVKPHLRYRSELDVDRAILLESRAIALTNNDDLAGSIKCNTSAFGILESPHLQSRLDLDEDRARILENSAITQRRVGLLQASLASFDLAVAIHEKPHLRDRPELDAERASLQMNRANTLRALGNHDMSLEGYDGALAILAKPYFRDHFEFDHLRATIFGNKSRLFSFLDITQRHEFAREGSRFLVDQLELASPPDDGKKYDSNDRYRHHFQVFHSNWLKVAIDKDCHEDVVRILVTIQGRDVAARILDELEGSGLADSNVPKTVKAYQETRLKLRKLRARIEDIVTGGKVSTVSDDENGGFLSVPGEVLAPAPDSEELKALREQYNASHGELKGKREAAAQEKGYGLLSRPYEYITLEKVKQTLKPNDQAMLILLDLGEENTVKDARFHALTIRNDKTHLVALPELHQAVKKMAEYPDAQRHTPNRALVAQGADAASRDYREGPVGHRGVTFGEVTPAYVEKDYRHFWESGDDASTMPESPLADLQKRYLWQPLASALDGVEKVISSSQGQLHSLPLQCGLPDGLNLRNYPGLVFYAGRRGLLGNNTNLTLDETVNAKKEPLGVYAYAGHGNDIPNTRKEIQWVWELHHDKRPLQTYPLNQKDPPHVHCLHMACHGAADSNRSGQVQLITGGQDQDTATLDMSDVLELPIKADVVYLGCCLAGQTVEDLEGEPTGLVSGFFLRGTRALVGSVVLVNDAWGAVFGVLFEYHFIATNDPQNALALAKADIASGNWDPAEFSADVRNHVESLRSANDQPFTPAPIPPQPILGDLLYGMRIFGE